MTINMLFGLFGGMAMLLYGMRLVGEGLQLAAGGKLRHVLGNSTSNRVKGLLAGAGITAIIQSSGATTVMLVSFASSGLITLPQTLGVILGADIGTTLHRPAHRLPNRRLRPCACGGRGLRSSSGLSGRYSATSAKRFWGSA